MSKRAFIRTPIEPRLKQSAENILHMLGMTPAQAITLLYQEVIYSQQWPLPLNVPNAATRKTLEQTDQGIGLIDSKDLDDLFKKIGI